MARRLIVGCSVLALLGLIVGSVWIASAGAKSKSKVFTRVLLLDDAELKSIDERPTGTSLGDQLVFSGVLLSEDESTEEGRMDGYCTVTSNPAGPEETRELCVATATGLPSDETPGAEIEMQGVGRVEAEDVDLGITGGTGVFRRAHGYATFDFTTENKAIVTFHVIH
jgi:hypothetical protein